MAEHAHELAPHHLPPFIPAADGADWLMSVMLIALIIGVILAGVFYLHLHSIPERLAHKHGRMQFELVAVLGLLALFTHNNIFWVAALLLAFIQLPDFRTPLESMAHSLSRLAGTGGVSSETLVERTRRLNTPPKKTRLRTAWRHRRPHRRRQARHGPLGKRGAKHVELLFCSLLTILPDFLIRRFVQDKRIGREITLYSVWYELRYGIVLCLILTVSLITLIFYYHPTSTSGRLFVPHRADPAGRFRPGSSRTFVPRELETEVKAGDPIFRLDSARQEADVATAEQQVAEIRADIALAQGELAVANAQVEQAQASLKQAQDELDTRQELFQRNANVVSERDIEKLQNTVDARAGGLRAAEANRDLVETKINLSLPARLNSAEARLAEARVELEKNDGLRGRRRHRQPVHPAQGRHRQPADEASGRADPGGRTARTHHCRFRPDRGAGV